MGAEVIQKLKFKNQISAGKKYSGNLKMVKLKKTAGLDKGCESTL
jgi:hypothetical protein